MVVGDENGILESVEWVEVFRKVFYSRSLMENFLYCFSKLLCKFLLKGLV